MPAEHPRPSLDELRRIARKPHRTPEEQAIFDAEFGEPIERTGPDAQRGVRFFVQSLRRPHPEATEALAKIQADLIFWGIEREHRHASEAVERGEASWLPWAAPKPPAPALTEDELRKRPRYRRRRPAPGG